MRVGELEEDSKVLVSEPSVIYVGADGNWSIK